MENKYITKYCQYDGTLLMLAEQSDNVDWIGCCPLCGYEYYNNPVPSIAFFLLDKSQVLLGRRAREPEKGNWDIPGGFIEPNESAENAVRREAFQESDLNVKVVSYLGSLPDTYGYRQIPTLNMIYVVERESGVLKAKDDVSELRWFPLDSIPEMAFPHQQLAIDILKKYLQDEKLT